MIEMEEKILGKNSLFELVTELESYKSENPDMVSIYIAPESALPEIPEVFNEVIKRIRKSATGAIIFSWQQREKNILVFPPFPVNRDEIFHDKFFRTEQLKEILTKEYFLGIILLRLGEYAVGIFEGNKLISSKCGKKLVRAKHRKGGYSQARFQRIREVQADRFFDEVYNSLKNKFEPYLSKLDYVLYGGTKITIKNFLKRNHLLKKISEKTLDRTLDVHEINKKALENILREIWKTKVLIL